MAKVIIEEDESLNVEVPERGEAFEIGQDVRHGREGFRVIRRIKSATEENTFVWDEWYQFYSTLSEAFQAIEKGEYTQGIKAF